MIEVMVAILLTVIATSGLVGLFTITTRSSGFSRHATEATILAQDQLERLRTSAFVGTNSETGIDGSGKASGIFDRSWSVADMGSYADLAVTVSWDEDGSSRNVYLVSRRNN